MFHEPTSPCLYLASHRLFWPSNQSLAILRSILDLTTGPWLSYKTFLTCRPVPGLYYVPILIHQPVPHDVTIQRMPPYLGRHSQPGNQVLLIVRAILDLTTINSPCLSCESTRPILQVILGLATSPCLHCASLLTLRPVRGYLKLSLIHI